MRGGRLREELAEAALHLAGLLVQVLGLREQFLLGGGDALGKLVVGQRSDLAGQALLVLGQVGGLFVQVGRGVRLQAVGQVGELLGGLVGVLGGLRQVEGLHAVGCGPGAARSLRGQVVLLRRGGLHARGQVGGLLGYVRLLLLQTGHLAVLKLLAQVWRCFSRSSTCLRSAPWSMARRDMRVARS